MNDQRKEVYEQRRAFMSADDVAETIAEMRRETIGDLVAALHPRERLSRAVGPRDAAGRRCSDVLDLDLPVADWAKEEGIDDDEMRERLEEAADRPMPRSAANIGPDMMRMVEKSLLLQIFDQVWKEHLLALDHLRQGIGLRAYGQRDPLNEYKSEAFELFNAMLADLRERVTSLLMRIELRPDAPPPMPERLGFLDMRHPDPAMAGGRAGKGRWRRHDLRGGADGDGTAAPRPIAEAVDPNDPATWRRTPRNAPCPCGSGKKYKHCHGRA